MRACVCVHFIVEKIIRTHTVLVRRRLGRDDGMTTRSRSKLMRKRRFRNNSCYLSASAVRNGRVCFIAYCSRCSQYTICLATVGTNGFFVFGDTTSRRVSSKNIHTSDRVVPVGCNTSREKYNIAKTRIGTNLFMKYTRRLSWTGKTIFFFFLVATFIEFRFQKQIVAKANYQSDRSSDVFVSFRAVRLNNTRVFYRVYNISFGRGNSCC